MIIAEWKPETAEKWYYISYRMIIGGKPTSITKQGYFKEKRMREIVDDTSIMIEQMSGSFDTEYVKEQAEKYQTKIYN